jgi:CRP-like cAMP-binding protein
MKQEQKIEAIPLELNGLDFEQVKSQKQILGLHTKKRLLLSEPHVQMLQLIQSKASIEQIGEWFLKKNYVLSYLQLRELLKFLSEEKLLGPLSVVQHLHENFENQTAQNLTESLWDKFFSSNPKTQIDPKTEIQKIPFFRSLEPETLSLFLQNMKVVEVPANIAICTEGQDSRGLFVLLSGSANVIKAHRSGRKQRVATLHAGSVFGETGFFLGEKRAADVVTTSPSTIVKFKYSAEIFEDKVLKEKAKSLQRRFWLIHALLKSEVFKDLPSDCFDALLFSGQIKDIPAGVPICREQEPGNTCYIVIQGELVVSQKGKSLKILGQGACFGEVALILSGGLRTATVTAQIQSLVMEIQSQNFYKLLNQNLALACELEELALSRYREDQARISK